MGSYFKTMASAADILRVPSKAIALAFALLIVAGGELSAQEYSFRSFGATEGLTNLVIRGIYQDRVGFIWVSTENGIFRYDGNRFEPFGPAKGLPLNFGATFGEAPDGSLLAGGIFGLYELSGNRFEKIATPFKTVSRVEGIQSDGKGHTFLATETGIVDLESLPGKHDFSFHEFPQPPGTSGPEANSILVDGDDLWYGCGLGLCRMNAHGTKVFSRDNGLPPARIWNIRMDGTGNLWVALEGPGIFVLPAGKANFERPRLPVPPSSIRTAPVLDSDRRLLLPSQEGLLIRDENGWQEINRTFGLRGLVTTVFEDRQHTLWIGMGGRGLVRWRGYREWQNYSTESGLASEVVYGILPRKDGALWVGTGSGLFRGAQQNSRIAFSIVPGFKAVVVHSLSPAPGGDIWAGSEGRGLARINPRTLATHWSGEADGLTGKDIYNLLLDGQNRLWVATDAGLFAASAPYRRFSRVSELPSTRTWALVQTPDGTLWAGGDSGLFALQSGRWKTFTPADGLSSLEVMSLAVGSGGDIWVGYQYGGGMDRIHPRAGGLSVEKRVERPGTEGVIYFLHFDSRGRLWAGTQHGVDVWDGARWTHYDMNDGLVWDDCDTNGFAEAQDGAFWIGTSGGLSRFTPRAGTSVNSSLEVVFTRLVVGKSDVSSLRNPSFDSHVNSLVARFSAINATRQNSVIFRYRLAGAASSWTETTQRELQFANLAPGAYLLQIQAREGDGDWSGNKAEFPFRILTPWYFTWWFTLLCAFIPLSMAAAALRLRFLSAQRRERELVRIVNERTADLLRANEELSRLSFSDSLTGLANRRALDQTLDRECARVRRTNSELSLLSIDVDQFKALNDSLGHQRGDECLILLGAELTRRCKRQLDLAARSGGEEFAIVLPDTCGDDALQFAESVRVEIEALKVPHPASPVSPFLTVSVGVATATRDFAFTRDDLVAAADRALYSAKRSGRNRVCVAQPETEPAAL